MLFQSLLKITRTLNTTIIWVQWKFTTPNQYFISIASPSFCLLRFFFFLTTGILLFQSNKHFQAIEFIDQPVLEKLYIFCINLS